MREPFFLIKREYNRGGGCVLDTRYGRFDTDIPDQYKGAYSTMAEGAALEAVQGGFDTHSPYQKQNQ